METIGQRIRKLRNKCGPSLTQAILANKIGLKGPAITQWELDKTKPKGENLIRLARYFNVTPDEILGIKPPSLRDEKANYLNSGRSKQVPLLSPTSNINWVEFFNDDLNHSTFPKQLTTSNVSDNSFAITCIGRSTQNPSGSPSIPDGSVAIVDTLAAPRNGSIVLFLSSESNLPSIRRFIVDGSETYLEPLNPEYKTRKIDESTIIIGVVKQVVQDL